VSATIAATRFAAIDFESAGNRPGSTDVPVQIGIATMDGLAFAPADLFSSYIACDRPVAWNARKVHGISDADLAGAPAFADLWPEVRARLAGRWVVGHGAATERRFLRAFPLHGFGPWIDTLTLARALDPGQPSHALGDLARAYGLEDDLSARIPGFRWHDAGSDAAASLVLLAFLVNRFGLSGFPPARLRVGDARPGFRQGR